MTVGLKALVPAKVDTAITKRKAISKKLRFDVFKRDGFICQYCGAAPPKVVLHADHIVPIVEGGPTQIDNLVTSCEGCNLGKGARSLTNLPQLLVDKAAEIAEREEQLRAYQKLIASKRKRLEKETWKILDQLLADSELANGCATARRDWLMSIRRFIESLGFEAVFDAAEIALVKIPLCEEKRFRYFCGICWHRIRDPE